MATLLRLRTATTLLIPASIGAPVQGTALTSVYQLQLSGRTGPRTPATNGVWNGASAGTGGSNTGLPQYLKDQGVTWDNTGALLFAAGTSAMTCSNFDFTGSPSHNYSGAAPGSVTFTDCVMPTGSLRSPVLGLNGSVNADTGTLPIILNYCTLDLTKYFLGSGAYTFNVCRIKNQIQNLGDVSLGGLGVAVVAFNDCYITGGGINAAGGAHIELMQFGRNVSIFPSCYFYLTRCLVDISKDGAATTSNLAFWTAAWSVTDCHAIYTDSILIGAAQVNANPNVPSTRLANGCPWHYYGQGSPSGSITNCVFDTSIAISKNADGGAARPVDGGGNRSFVANTAITAANFG